MLKNVLFVNVNIRNNTPDLDRLEEAIARFGDRAIGIKVYFDVNSSEVTDITPLAQICKFARAKGLRVMVHSSDSPTPMSEILGVLGKGDILTHAYHGGVHTAADDDFASIKAAKARGVIIDAGFAGHIHTDFAIFQRAIEAGALPDTISTDITKFSAYTRGGRYGMTMCMSMARHMGMSEENIFRAVTSSPARVLGKGDEWGALRVGAEADICVLDYTFEGFDLTDKAGNHIESQKGYRCVLTVSDGQVVYRN
jgi:dihydroorotase